jgi:hypothetical protein
MFLNIILICYFHYQIFEFCHTFAHLRDFLVMGDVFWVVVPYCVVLQQPRKQRFLFLRLENPELQFVMFEL